MGITYGKNAVLKQYIAMVTVSFRLAVVIVTVVMVAVVVIVIVSRSQWPRGLRRRSATARLLRSWVRIPPGAWMFVCCGCCVLSGRGLCDELIARPEESYRL